MSDKKMQGRFTIQFNLNDPQQKKVSDCLEEQGRRKTQFITNAVLYYLNCENNAPKPNASSILPDSVLESILMKMFAKTDVLGTETHESEIALQRTSAVDSKSDDTFAQASDEPDYSALTSSLMELDKI